MTASALALSSPPPGPFQSLAQLRRPLLSYLSVTMSPGSLPELPGPGGTPVSPYGNRKNRCLSQPGCSTRAGMRRGEVIGQQRGDADLDAATVTVRRIRAAREKRAG